MLKTAKNRRLKKIIAGVAATTMVIAAGSALAVSAANYYTFDPTVGFNTNIGNGQKYIRQHVLSLTHTMSLQYLQTLVPNLTLEYHALVQQILKLQILMLLLILQELLNPTE